jgi:hypothetical protein
MAAGLSKLIFRHADGSEGETTWIKEDDAEWLIEQWAARDKAPKLVRVERREVTDDVQKGSTLFIAAEPISYAGVRQAG